MSEIYIIIRRNEENSDVAKQISIRKSDNFEDVLQKLGNKLQIDAKKIFAENGAEIDDANDIRDKDTIYVSQGEAFFKTVSSKQKISPSRSEAISSVEEKKNSKIIQWNVFK